MGHSRGLKRSTIRPRSQVHTARIVVPLQTNLRQQFLPGNRAAATDCKLVRLFLHALAVRRRERQKSARRDRAAGAQVNCCDDVCSY